MAIPPGLDPALEPHRLPSPGSADRWPWLQQLRRRHPFPLEPWLAAIEAGGIQPHPDLMAVLVDRLDGPAAARLLAWWRTDPQQDPALPELVGRVRHPGCAVQLRLALAGASDSALPVALLPLLGHQRDAVDFPRLRRLALQPASRALRLAALEGLMRGLSAWPLAPLRRTLVQLAGDLDPELAAQAVDGLARLPAARRCLLPLARGPVAPAVAERIGRRLRALPPSCLLLVVHGRAGGLIPAELGTLAAELQERRGAPVWLQALTAELPAEAPEGSSAAPLTLVPLFLLPGAHVRLDLPAISTHWRQLGPLRRVPFLGAWSSWQQVLAAEAAELAVLHGTPPLLLHHPVEGRLARRYLAHLETTCVVRCRATPYSAADPQDFDLACHGAILPLALGANRLTDGLGLRVGPPLLARPRCRGLLLDQLEALP